MDPNKGKFGINTFFSIVSCLLPLGSRLLLSLTCREGREQFASVISHEDRVKMMIMGYANTVDVGPSMKNGEPIIYCDDFEMSEIFCRYANRFKQMLLREFSMREVLRMKVTFNYHDFYLSTEIMATDETQLNVNGGVGGFVERVRPLVWTFKPSYKRSANLVMLHVKYCNEVLWFDVTPFQTRMAGDTIHDKFVNDHPDFVGDFQISFK